ncbi:subtilisin-like protease SBT1.6 isoform X1 [Camellia sinensis]|uniref:subtilisin-like protease SBT1.6 isoform X1 n=1 Tax=Camellia sinensis TaxID=4442 RepID=UPI00103642C5|nr:subtilisin-like protease SBT1.6 isoform X1 [Camellia sinensis]
MGNNSPKPFYNDVYMISTLKAAQNDIFVTFGAGNMGSMPSTVVNSAPWVTTVGSNTIDRTYPAKVRVENGEQVRDNFLYCGRSITDDAFPLQFYSTCTYDNIPSDSIKALKYLLAKKNAKPRLIRHDPELMECTRQKAILVEEGMQHHTANQTIGRMMQAVLFQSFQLVRLCVRC